MSSSNASNVSVSAPKKVVFFLLENILVPGKAISDVDVSASKVFLQSFAEYASKKNIQSFLLSSHSEEWARAKVVEHGLDVFFPVARVFGVNAAYVDAMEPIDRVRYDAKLKEDPACTDEYYRQVAMLEIIAKNHFSRDECVLLGQDYWFDGFYTRRYAQIDVIFVEPRLTSRSNPILEKISGVWYAALDLKPLQKILEGRVERPNYAPLDTWTSVTLTEELLGAKDFNMIKRVIIEKKKDGTYAPHSPGAPLPPTS